MTAASEQRRKKKHKKKDKKKFPYKRGGRHRCTSNNIQKNIVTKGKDLG